MSEVHLVDHPLVQHKLSLMRDVQTPTGQFRELVREIAFLLGYGLTRDLPTAHRMIATPLTEMSAPFIYGKKLALISVLRAGNGLLEGLLDLIPTARVGHIGIYRDPSTLAAVEYYFKVPSDLATRQVIVADPMLATAHSSVAAVRRVKGEGAQDIKMVCLVASPEGIEKFSAIHSDVPIFTAAIDDHLNDHGYIAPGLGDAGDRMYGTR